MRLRHVVQELQIGGTRSGSRRHERIYDAGGLDRMPGLPRQHQCGLKLQFAKCLTPEVESRAEMTFLPDQYGAAPPQIACVDPGGELWVTVRENVWAIRRIDRKIVDREFGAAGIDERRVVALAPRPADGLGHDLARELGGLGTVVHKRLAEFNRRIGERPREKDPEKRGGEPSQLARIGNRSHPDQGCEWCE